MRQLLDQSDDWLPTLLHRWPTHHVAATHDSDERPQSACQQVGGIHIAAHDQNLNQFDAENDGAGKEHARGDGADRARYMC